MPLTYGRNTSTQGQDSSRPSEIISFPGVPMQVAEHIPSMRDDERERMQSRFGNRAFWQNHNDRTHARACANVPSGNPFVPRPNGPNIHQPVPGYGQGSQQDGQLSAVAQWLQAAHTGPGEPRHDQHQADWDDDEGYSSADGLDLNPPPPQNVHFIIPQSNNRNNGFQPGVSQSNSSQGNRQGPVAPRNNAHIQAYGYASHGAYMPPAPESEYSQYSSHLSRR